jgi:L-ascorbate metabolism protein UlaG (beta-lactamase superfamily)
MKITMIGHSTVLIEAAGKRILTDPYLSPRGNPAYARVRPPARSREDLIDTDFVLISHNHWDHIDGKFLRMLPPSLLVFAPAISSWMTRLKGGRNVIGLKPWQKKEFDGFSITAVPARHITFTIGYVLEGGEGNLLRRRHLSRQLHGENRPRAAARCRADSGYNVSHPDDDG